MYRQNKKQKQMKPLTILEKFKLSLTNISEKENGSFSFDTGVMYHSFLKDPDLPIIEEKIKNLILLMEKENKKGNIDSFMERDIETDLWFLI